MSSHLVPHPPSLNELSNSLMMSTCRASQLPRTLAVVGLSYYSIYPNSHIQYRNLASNELPYNKVTHNNTSLITSREPIPILTPNPSSAAPHHDMRHNYTDLHITVYIPGQPLSSLYSGSISFHPLRPLFCSTPIVSKSALSLSLVFRHPSSLSFPVPPSPILSIYLVEQLSYFCFCCVTVFPLVSCFLILLFAPLLFLPFFLSFSLSLSATLSFLFPF